MSVEPKNNWTDLSSQVSVSDASSVENRSRVGIAYDSTRNLIVMYGGKRKAGVIFNDTWIFNYTDKTWYNITKPGFPSKRYKARMVYYESADRFILFGGNDDTNPRFDETWEFNMTDYKWYLIDVPSGNKPPGRDFFGMVYDSDADRVILFGGISDDLTMLDDTWIFNYSDSKWYNVTQDDSNYRPDGREEFSMAYDSKAKRTIMHGGFVSGQGRIDDTWQFNYTDKKWYKIGNFPTIQRSDHEMAYDTESSLTFMFGGGAGYPVYYNDIWAFNYSDKTWYNVTPGGINPPDTQWSGFVYYESEDVIISFGGDYQSGFGTYNDTWQYEYTLGDTCNNGNECQSGLCIEGYCRSSCETYNKLQCSDDSNDWQNDGICLDSSQGWQCVENIPSSCDFAIINLTDTFILDRSNTYHCLNQSFYLGGLTAIQFTSGVQNSTLDCLGYNLDSDRTVNTYGVYLTGGNTKNNTIKNCYITDWFDGIYLYFNPQKNLIKDNTFNNNERGIELSFSDKNTLMNNTVTTGTYWPGYGILMSGADYNNVTGNTIDGNSRINRGLFLSDSSNNAIINNIIREMFLSGVELVSDSDQNTLENNTIILNNDAGIYIDCYCSNGITGGSIRDNANDIYLRNPAGRNYFRDTDFTGTRRIYFGNWLAQPWFNYNNATMNGIWLNTTVDAKNNGISRKLTSWNTSLVQWNDSGTVTAKYKISGLNPNKIYILYNNSKQFDTKETNANGVLPTFSVDLLSEHEIKVEEASDFLIIDSITILPSDNVIPIAGGNTQMNVTVNVTNSTTINTCTIRIFNASDVNLYPSMPDAGTIQKVDSQIQCFYQWDMEYWRNPGQWNISVNLSDSVSNFTSKNFTYTELYSIDINVSTINFTGLPGETVNSTNAYPMSIKNTGNVKLNVSINGTDLIGESDSSKVIGVGNVSYDESETGSFVPLTNDYSLVFSFLSPTEERHLYFRAYIPLGFKAQYYNNTIGFKKVKA